MPKAKKLKSGSWRVQVYDYTDESGKIHRRSFTSKDPSPAGRREVEFMAAEFAAKKKAPQSTPAADLTFGEALNEYIDKRSAILSPATIREYDRIRKHDLQGLMSIRLRDMTQEQIQAEINREALSHSPKTVRNLHGILSAVMAAYRPDFKLSTALPQKVRPNLHIPSEEEIRDLMGMLQGTWLELPVLLAAIGPMRCGEICALGSDHVNGNIVHVEFSLAKDRSGQWVRKRTKTYAGDRYITYPDFVAEKLAGIEGRIVNTTPSRLSNAFCQRMRRNRIGLERFRFHDLRHYAASIMHAIGIPDQYIMARGGWATDATLKAVYRHTLSGKDAEMEEKANAYFEDFTRNCTQK